MPQLLIRIQKTALLTAIVVALLLGNQNAVSWATAVQPIAVDAPAALESSTRHTQASRMVTRFAERAHYSRTAIDDELSRNLLDNFIKSLDSNKHYFLASDIEYFQRYRDTMDDTLRNNDMDPVFDIFRIYRLRAQQNLNYIIQSLNEEPDFSVDETYLFDREDLPWATSEAELQNLWRQRMKNDAISLMLAEKTWGETAEVLDKRYNRLLKRINDIDSDEVIENFLNAFTHTLDPHSSYMSPRNSEEYRIAMSLSYQGIGASLQLEEDYVTIINIIPGGPAAIDGKLQPNDRITAVGQQESGELVDVIGWELDDVVQLIRGESGTTVRLQILGADSMPGDQEVILELVRDKVKLEERAAKSEIIETERDGIKTKVGVISVPSFYMDFEARSRGDKDYVSTTRDVRTLILELEKEGITGLVMDLRGNGGGHLSEATALSGLFINAGPMVQLRDTSGRIEVLDDPEPTISYSGPLVVLVNRYSASASEIFAAAIQDYGRGLVVGQQTFGKGTVQNLYDLDQYTRVASDPGLGQLTLTIGKYYRVNGGSTQNRGVIPDIELPSAIDTKRTGESSRPGALPWDQIRSAQFEEFGSVQPDLQSLREAQALRAADNADYEFLMKNVDAANEIRSQNSVSLNIETRRTEQARRRDDRLVRENDRRQANGEMLLEDNDELEGSEMPDVLLEQAAQIVTDYAAIPPKAPKTVVKASAPLN
jgi:carboxyl-terminal processing protease|tara:strand:+ start:837 stop:2972 length:2136 start_codon:yes stop_codon:yes gene_type:complete